MYRITMLLLALVVVAPAAGGEKKFDPEGRAKLIAPYLDDQTFALLHVDATRLDLEAMATRVADITKQKREGIAKEMAKVGQMLAAFKQAGGKDLFALVSLADLPGPPVFVVPLAEGADVQALRRFLEQAGIFPGGTVEKIGRALVVGREPALVRLRNLKAAPPPELARAFAAAGDTTVRYLLLPGASSRQLVEQKLPNLPKELGGGPITTLTRGIQFAAVGVDVTPKASVRLVVQSPDAQAAQKLHDLITEVYKKIGEQKGGISIVNAAQLALLTPKVTGDRLTLTVDEQQIVALLVPAVQKVREAAARTQSSNNLRQITIAMFNHHDVYKTFPAHAIYDKNGRPLLSWRVHILPFIEQDNLYKEFHLDEPWDSEHNRKLIARMPKVYASPLSKVNDEHKTVYLVPVGKDTVFPPGPKGIRLTDVTDGLSNTIAVVEAVDSRAVPWTKPEDLKVDAKEPLAGLTDGQRTGFFTAFADGSSHYLATTINPQTLWALFTCNGGEAVEVP